jgi:hypothetical protein
MNIRNIKSASRLLFVEKLESEEGDSGWVAVINLLT